MENIEKVEEPTSKLEFESDGPGIKSKNVTYFLQLLLRFNHRKFF